MYEWGFWMTLPTGCSVNETSGAIASVCSLAFSSGEIDLAKV
jgi:hypothetical protein